MAGSDPRRVFAVGAAYDGAGRFVDGAELFVEGAALVRLLARGDRGAEAERLRRRFEGARRIEVADGLALPGLINCHHHAYSAFARGVPIRGPMADFPSVLENLWWGLDRALDADSVRLSGLVTALESVRRGCTTVVDHHSSPRCVRGSLAALAGAFDAFSMTSVLCFETSDRNGAAVLDESVEENLEFAAAHAGAPRSRGLFGLHAGFTLSRATLERLARAVPEGLPIHVHVAEDRCDAEHARAEGFAGPLDRLAALGVLRRRSLLGHCVHLADAELPLVAAHDAFVAHNPESNLNNAVGCADLDRLPPERLLIGTDGMGPDALGAARIAFLAYKGLGRGTRDPLELARRMLFANPSAYLSALFGRPVGRIAEGAPADFAIFDYPAPTPIGADNVLGHLLYGLAPAPPAAWVYANGTPVVEAGRVTAVDERALLDEARAAAAGVWRRYTEQVR